VQAGPLAIVSGNNQTLPTRTDSAPLVVELRTTTGVPLVGASLLWISENAQTSTTRTVTDDQGRASNIAQVLLPGVARVTVQVEGSSATTGGSVVFTLNGGVANIPTLDEPEETVGDAIDQLCPNLAGDSTLTPGEADLLARCLELVNNAGANPGQVEEALVQLQQDIALAQADAALLAAATQFNNVKTRMAALRSGAMGIDVGGLAIANSSGTMPLSFLPSSVVQGEDVNEGGGSAEVGSDFSRWGFFASGTIGRGEHDADSVTPEYDYDTQGLTAGIDYRVNESWIVGASLGYNQQDTEVGDGRGGIDASGWSVSGYTTWYHANNWYLDGVLTFGSNDYDISRSILYDIVATGGGVTRVDQTATGSSGGDQLSLAVSFGRDFQSGAWSYGPYLRGNYTRLEFDGYDEVLEAGIGNGLGLSVEGRELKSMTGVVGGKVTYAISRDWGILMPHAQIEWEHEFKDDPQSLVTRFLNDPTRTTIRERGVDVDTDYYNIGFGLSALFPGGRSAFFYYEHLAGSEGVSQDNLSLGVRIEF
jgi:outer membrane autotransporter protein